MSEQLAPLRTIQKIDTRLQELTEALEVWPRKIEDAQQRRDELEQRQEALSERRTQLQVERDKLELEAKEETERILTYEKHIREIKTNREYQALVREVGVSKKAKSDAEETALKLMEEIESVEAELKELDDQIKEVDKELDEYQKAYDEAKAESKSEMDSLRKERKDTAKEIPKQVLSRYDLVRKRHANVLVHAEDETCTGCRRKLPPQLYNQVLRDDHLVTCPSCKRLLLPPEEALEAGGAEPNEQGPSQQAQNA